MHRFLSTFAVAVLGLFVLAACDDSTSPRPDPLPDVAAVEVVDTAGSIFRSVKVTLDHDGAVEVYYQPVGGGRILRTRADSLASVHDILLPRLYAETEYEYAIRSFDAGGASDSIARGTFTTDSLPSTITDFNYSVSGTSSFPILMVPFRSGDWAGQVGIESDGAIVWYMESVGGTLVAAPVPGTHDMVFMENGFPNDGGRNGIVRVNPRRQVVALLDRDNSPSGRIHHDMTALDDERVLFLAYDTMTVRDTVVTGEAVWQWNTTTGSVVKRWSAWDFLDWDTERDPAASPSGWLHANSITVGPRGNVVISFRTLNQVISIAPDYQSLEWRIGGPGATVGLSDDDRFVGQHAATEVAPGRVLLFDNRGAGPDDDRSRALELQVDGDTAYAVWDYTPDPPILAALRGGTYRLDNGNTVTIFPSIPFAVHETTPDGTVIWTMTGDLLFTSTFRAAPWPSIDGEVEVDAMP